MRRQDQFLYMFLLFLVISARHAHKTEVHTRMCGFRGLCRRVCFTREYNIGHHGCPHRYRCCAARSEQTK